MSALNEAVAMLLMAYAAEKQRQEALAEQQYRAMLAEQDRQAAEARRAQQEFDNRWENKLARRADIAKSVCSDYFDPLTASAVKQEIDKIARSAPQVAEGEIHSISRREIDKKLKTIQSDLSVLSAAKMGHLSTDDKAVKDALSRADDIRAKYYPTREEMAADTADKPVPETAGKPALFKDPPQSAFEMGMTAGRAMREDEERRRARMYRSRTAVQQQWQLSE